MSEYVIGVDIGGTKSHLALFDTAGNLVDFNHWGPLNHESLPGSFAQAEDEMGQFFDQTLTRNNVSFKEIAYSVLGVAGVDTKRQHGIISEILKRIGLENFTLVNDAFLGIPAGNPTGIGICAINGTGCTLAGINREGMTLQIGGVGYISDDYGGGGHIGRDAVSAIYRELFRKGEPTSMTPTLLKELGVTDKHDFVDKVYDKIAEGTFRALTGSKMVFMAVLEHNDKVAAGILRNVGLNYGNGISCMIDEMKYHRDEDLYVVLAGSVFVKGEHPMIIDTVKETVQKYHPDYNVKYTVLEVPPVAGGVIWALNKLGENTKGYDYSACYNKVRAQLQEN